MAFDSSQYAWKDITVQVGDVVLQGIQGVRYKSAQEKEYLYGKGVKPLAIQEGNEMFDGELKLLQTEVQSLASIAPFGKLSKLKDMIVTIAYDKSNDGGELTVDQLVGVTFTETDKGMDQNAKNMVVTLPIMMLDVLYNI